MKKTRNKFINSAMRSAKKKIDGKTFFRVCLVTNSPDKVDLTKCDVVEDVEWYNVTKDIHSKLNKQELIDWAKREIIEYKKFIKLLKNI